MTPEQRTARARAVLGDEILTEVFEQSKARINKELLNATAQEEREQKWQEYHALERVWRLLNVWAAEQPKKPNE